MIDFRLKVFFSVAKNLSFTKAAKELFISQPAISKHIQELENHYQTRLFERLGNHITLTKEGELLLSHVEHIILCHKQLEYEMNLLQNKYSGELNIGASTTIAQYVLPTLLAEFSQRFPQISLSLLNGNSREIENALSDHRIDVGFVEGNIRQNTFKYNLFMKDELVAVAHTKCILSKRDEISLEELKTIPMVLRERGSGTLDVLEKELQNHSIKLSHLNIKMYLGSTESIKRFIEHSTSIGFVSIRSISKEIAEGKFKVIEIPELELTREFNFIQRIGEENGLTKMFIQFAEHYKE